MSPRFSRIRRFIEAALLLLLLVVCISIGMGRFTIINLSSLLADAGQMRPVLRYEQQSERTHSPTRILKKGELYVVEVPIAFIPARNPIFIHETPGHPNRNTLAMQPVQPGGNAPPALSGGTVLCRTHGKAAGLSRRRFTEDGPVSA